MEIELKCIGGPQPLLKQKNENLFKWRLFQGRPTPRGPFQSQCLHSWLLDSSEALMEASPMSSFLAFVNTFGHSSRPQNTKEGDLLASEASNYDLIF